MHRCNITEKPSPSPPVSSNNKSDGHDITEIVLKVALNTIKQINKQTIKQKSLLTEDIITNSTVHHISKKCIYCYK